jgi:YidC/Oxa1 family membrane protein insertase
MTFTFALMVFGLLEPIERPLQALLEWIHTTIGVPWGWAIVILTCMVRIAMIPLTVKQQQSMRAMQSLQPEIKKLQAKHKGDRQKLNQETMEFYRENKVNPFGSCIPLVVQAPVFIALYFVLRNLKNNVQPGDDLSFISTSFVPDITKSLHELPTWSLAIMMILYVGSQMLSTLLMPTSLDKTQRYIFLALPVVFAVVILNQTFPAGLLIYWITTNLWTVGQALVIRQFFPPPQLAAQRAKMDAAKPKPKPKLDKPKAEKPRAEKPNAAEPPPGDESEAAAEAPAEAAPPKKPTRSGQTRGRSVRRPVKPNAPRRPQGGGSGGPA